MPLKAKYEHEIRTWQKELEALQQENVLLKTQTANIIKDDINFPTLEKMELFLSSFINKDAVIALLRYDLAEQLKLIRRDNSAATTGLLNKAQEKLRQDMLKMNLEFSKLKTDFESYAGSLTSAS